MLYIRSVQSGCKEDFSWELSVEFRSSKWADSRELGSARKAEKMALCAQLAVGLWREDFTCAVIQWDCYSSCVKIHCQETDSEECNNRGHYCVF
jgi:hypothetical protein